MKTSVFTGLHVDDSEVTLNICLGKQFSGGELFFRGVRCDEHVTTETLPEVTFVSMICICLKFLCMSVLMDCFSK